MSYKYLYLFVLMILIIYKGAVPTSNCYTKRSLVYYIRNVKCNGTEQKLLDCTHSKAAVPNCYQSQLPGVICKGKDRMHT